WRPSVDNRHKIGWRDNDGAGQCLQSVATIPSPHPTFLAVEPLEPLLLGWLRSGVERSACRYVRCVKESCCHTFDHLQHDSLSHRLPLHSRRGQHRHPNGRLHVPERHIRTLCRLYHLRRWAYRHQFVISHCSPPTATSSVPAGSDNPSDVRATRTPPGPCLISPAIAERASAAWVW